MPLENYNIKNIPGTEDLENFFSFAAECMLDHMFKNSTIKNQAENVSKGADTNE